MGQNRLSQKNPNIDAQQVFRQFAWNLAGSLKSPKASKNKASKQNSRLRRGKKNER